MELDEITEVADISARRRITFYDASYILLAKKMSCVLVTEDRGMRQAAEAEGVKVIDSRGLPNVLDNACKQAKEGSL